MDKILSEAAEVILGRLSDPKDAEFIETASIDDPAWNDLFFKYLTDSNAQKSDGNYVRIKATNLSYSNNESMVPVSGYISFSGEVGNRKRRFLPGYVSTIDARQLSVVPSAAEASIFQEEDAEAILKAIKNNPDLELKGNGELKIERVTQESIPSNLTSAEVILKYYFSGLCETGKRAIDSPANRFAEKGFKVMFNLSRALDYPLVGNRLLSIFANAYQTKALREDFVVDSNSVTKIYQIIAKGIVNSQALMNPKTFTASVCFNKNLLKLSSDEIADILSLYDEVRRKARYATDYLPIALAGWKEIDQQLPRHLLLKQPEANGSDPLTELLSGEVQDINILKPIPSDFEHGDSTPLLDWEVRRANEMERLFIKLFPEVSESSGKKNAITLCLLCKKDSRIKEVKRVDSSIDGDEGSYDFASVVYPAGTEIRFVWAKSSDKAQEKWESEKPLKLPSSFQGEYPQLKKLDDTSIMIEQEWDGKISVEGIIGRTEDKPFTITEITYKTSRESEKEKSDKAQVGGKKVFDSDSFVEVPPYSGQVRGDTRYNVSLKAGDCFIGRNGKRYRAKEDRDDYEIKANTYIWLRLPTEEDFDGHSLMDIMTMDSTEHDNLLRNLSPRAKAYLTTLQIDEN